MEHAISILCFTNFLGRFFGRNVTGVFLLSFLSPIFLLFCTIFLLKASNTLLNLYQKTPKFWLIFQDQLIGWIQLHWHSAFIRIASFFYKKKTLFTALLYSEIVLFFILYAKDLQLYLPKLISRFHHRFC